MWTQRDLLVTPSVPLKAHWCGGRHPLPSSGENDPSSQAMDTQLAPGGQPTLAPVGSTGARDGGAGAAGRPHRNSQVPKTIP